MISVPINPQNIQRHELISLKTTIIISKDPTMIHVTGTIIDETQKTLTIRTDKKTIMTAKKDNTYKMILKDSQEIELDGKLIYGRPEDRIKKKKQNKYKTVQ